MVPSSIVYLIVKLRRTPPRVSPAPTAKEKDADETKRILKFNDEKDNQFLNSKEEAEGDSSGTGWVHAPYWPGVCDLLLSQHKLTIMRRTVNLDGGLFLRTTSPVGL